MNTTTPSSDEEDHEELTVKPLNNNPNSHDKKMINPMPSKNDQNLLEAIITASEILGKTNKSPEAIDRDLEAALLTAPNPPFLGTMTEEEVDALQDTYLGRIILNVEIPESVDKMLEVINESGNLPIPKAVITKMERLVAFHHGVAPDRIEASVLLIETGKEWKYLPEAARVLTGFHCYPEEKSPFHEATQSPTP